MPRSPRVGSRRVRIYIYILDYSYEESWKFVMSVLEEEIKLLGNAQSVYIGGFS